MTIINVNSISGINSITAQGASGIEFFDSSGSSVQKVTGDGLTVGTGATISGSTNTIRFDTGVNPPVQIDSNGHVGIGTNNNTGAALDVHGDIRISRGGRGDGTGKIMFGSDSGDYLQLQDIGTGGNIFELVQDGSKKVVVRGTNGNVGIGTDNPTKALHLAQNSDIAIRMDSNNANADARVWEIVVGGNASNNTEMVFRTRQDDGTGGSECARIKRNGVIALPSGGGIDFSATGDGSGTASSELFDDYEEGTFTPTLLGAVSSPNVTYNTSNTHGSYVKVGNLVSFTLEIRTESRTGGSGSIQIGGLPYGAASIGGFEHEYEFPLMLYNVAFNTDYLYTAELVGVTNYIILRGHTSGGSDANLQVSAWENTNPTLCRITGSYRVA